MDDTYWWAGPALWALAARQGWTCEWQRPALVDRWTGEPFGVGIERTAVAIAELIPSYVWKDYGRQAWNS